jgi:hypothetical protein
MPECFSIALFHSLVTRLYVLHLWRGLLQSLRECLEPDFYRIGEVFRVNRPIQFPIDSREFECHSANEQTQIWCEVEPQPREPLAANEKELYPSNPHSPNRREPFERVILIGQGRFKG